MSTLTQILLAALAAVWVLPFACVAALIVLDWVRDRRCPPIAGDDGLNILNALTTVDPHDDPIYQAMCFEKWEADL